MKTENENRKLYKKCVDKYYQKSRWQYTPNDFASLKLNNLISEMEKGNISISSFQDFQMINNELVCSPMLYIKARSIDIPIIDLISLPNHCSNLSDNNCLYDFSKRPSEGENLISNKEYYPQNSFTEFALMWQPYQSLLRKIVKKYTGKSVDEELRSEVYNLFLDYFIKKYQDSSLSEYENISAVLSQYKSAFPNEYYNAFISYCAKYANNVSTTKRTRKK